MDRILSRKAAEASYTKNPLDAEDNVFVQLLCSIQYRVIKENADDAFYELQNPKEQIQAYVFDVVRAHVPRMTLDELFEQKGDVAQAVLEELEKFECLADRRQTSKSATYIANRPTIRKNQGRIMTMSSLQSTPLLHMLEQVMGLGRRMAWIFCVE